MRKLILSTGLCMTALTALVFVVYQVAAEPDAQGGAATGESSPISEQRAKVAAGANANATLSLDLIPNGGAGDQRDNEVTSGTASGRDTIAIEVFATGVTTSLIGMQLQFAFDATLLTFVKAENRAFVFNVPQPTGTDFAAFSPVRLGSSGFLARAEFTTAPDVTGREFSIGLGLVTLSESLSSSDTLTTTSRISFNVPTTSTADFNGNGKVDFPDFLAFVAQYGTRRGDSRYEAKYDLNSDGAIDFQDFLSFASSYGKSVPPSGGGSRSPDLVVESPSVSNSTLTPGQSFTLQATVRNRGTGPSAATTLRYHQSSDATIATSDRSVGTDAVSGLSASGTGLESIPLTAPLTPGTYYYGACVASVSNEKDTSNNCSTGVRVTVGGGGGGGGSRSPDLIVEAPSVSDSTLTPGQSFTLQATVRNRGTGPSAATTLRYHQSSDATIATSDRSVGTDAVSVLSASGTGLESILLTAPLSAGTYYYGACVAAVSGETDVSNNCSTGIRVTVGAPDLVVQSASVDNTTLTPGQSLTLSAKVHNQGMAEAAATTLRYYRSTDATITTGDTEVGTDSVNRLAARNGLDTSVRLTAPAATGTYYYGACVASSGESNTDNNCSTGVQVIVGAPGLLVQSVSVDDTTPTPGQAITLRATVGNRGTAAATAATLHYYQSSDATITTGDTEVGTADAISALAVSATSEQSSRVTAPLTAGTYYYGACVLVRGLSDTNNNCSAGVRVVVGAPDLLVQSPAVDNTTPTTGQAFTLSATVFNRGTAEVAAATLRYYRSTDATITTGDTEVGTSDAISVLAVSAKSVQSSSVTAPSTTGTYYYGACVDAVSGESNTNNNCSAGVQVTVGAPDLLVQSPVGG